MRTIEWRSLVLASFPDAVRRGEEYGRKATASRNFHSPKSWCDDCGKSPVPTQVVSANLGGMWEVARGRINGAQLTDAQGVENKLAARGWDGAAVIVIVT